MALWRFAVSKEAVKLSVALLSYRLFSREVMWFGALKEPCGDKAVFKIRF